VGELPRREACALQRGTRLRRQYLDALPRGVLCVHDPESGSNTGRRQTAGIAVGEDARSIGEFGSAERSDALTRVAVLGLDAQRFVQRIVRTRDALDGPAQVHGRRTRLTDLGDAIIEWPSFTQPENDAECAADADGRCGAY